MKGWMQRSKRKGGKKGLIYIILFIIGLFILFRSGYKFFEMKEARDDLKTEIAALEESKLINNEKIKNLYNDEKFVEKVAREQLNLVKEGETVYIIAEE